MRWWYPARQWGTWPAEALASPGTISAATTVATGERRRTVFMMRFLQERVVTGNC
jgi:hypothetical protein